MRIAFIGGWGHHYLRGLLNDPHNRFDGQVAVASDTHDPDAARRLAASLGQPQWFDRPEHLLDGFRPDFVSVGAVYGYNADMIALALERDIPTVSDKPIAASWPQLARLTSLIRATRRILLTEFDMRLHPAYQAAARAVAAGQVGEVVLATAQKSYKWGSRPSWYADRDAYGGTMLWIASHAIDAIRFTTGKRFLRVTGRQGNLSQPRYAPAEDHAVALFELEGGATAIAHADLMRPAHAATHGDDRLRLVGTKGLVEIRDGSCWLTTHDQPQRCLVQSESHPFVHPQLLAALAGQPSEFFSTAASLELAAVLLAARDAADAFQTVTIAPPPAP